MSSASTPLWPQKQLDMQVFQMYNSPMQPCFTPPRHTIGHGHFVGTPVQSVSPWTGAPLCSPHQNVLVGIQMATPTKAQEPAERHFQYQIGDVLERSSRHPNGRYRIVKPLGSGVYGRVLECTDRKGGNVAIKIVRAEHAYRECAKREIFALQTIGVHENVCQILGSFDFRGHVCIVQTLIPGGTVFDRIKEKGAYTLRATQKISSQLLCALAHIHKCNLLHTDIKTDNIMIDGNREDGAPRIKLVDLGSAILRNDRHPDLIGTKEYRSPEAVLQAGWSSGADIWAMGCSIFELFAGERLFEFEHEITQLHMLERVLGKLPLPLLQRASLRRNKHSAHLLAPASPALAPPCPDEAGKIAAAAPLSERIAEPELLGLLEQMLSVDAAARPSAQALRQHAFFALELPADSPEPSPPHSPTSTRSSCPSKARDTASAELPSTHSAASTIDVTLETLSLRVPGTDQYVEGVRC